MMVTANQMSPFVRQQGAVALYRFPLLDAAGFRSFVTGRSGGVSKGAYTSLNTDPTKGDDPVAVAENIDRIQAHGALPPLYLVKQIHSAVIVDAGEGVGSGSLEGDGIIVDRPGVTVAVKTADCVPILVADPTTRTAAAIHAGRRGVERGIVIAAINKIVTDKGGNPSDFLVGIAPHIRKCCYEIDVEAADRFHHICGGNGTRMIDLTAVVIKQLESVGIRRENVADASICTACNYNEFYSHRIEGPVTGRFLSGIALEGA